MSNTKKILVLTQNHNIGQQLEAALSATDMYELHCLNLAIEAVQLVNQVHIDLGLIDMEGSLMAEFFGAKELSQGDITPPLVLLCHNKENQIPLEVLSHNIKGYIQYPFDQETVQSKLAQFLEVDWTEVEYKQLVGVLSSFNQALEDRIKEATILQGVGRSVNMTLDLDSVLNRVVEAATFITKAEEGYLMLREPGSNELYLRAAKDMDERRARVMRLKVNDSVAGSVVQSGQPIILNGDTHKHFKVQTGYIVHSLINVPLKVGEQVIGILGVDNPSHEKSFTSDHLRNLMNLASSAATAIENAHLYHQTASSLSKRMMELDTLRALLRDIHVSSDRAMITQLVLSHILKAINAELGILGWLGTEEPIWTTQGPLASGLLNPTSLNDKLAQKQQALEQLMAARQSSLSRSNYNPSLTNNSHLTVPILWENQPVGIIHLESTEAEAFNQNDLYFLQAVANHTALAIQTSTMLQTTSSLQERLSLLMDNTEDAVWIVDLNLEIIDLNRTAGQLLAWQPEQVIGQACESIWTQPDKQGHREIGKYLKQAMVVAGKASFGQTITLTSDNGQDILVEGAAYSMFDQGRTIGAVAIFRPASADQAVEQMQTEFISMASHNLRTPLMSILASLDHVLDAGRDPEKNRKMLLEARIQSKKIAQFLRDMLDISQLTVGREAPLNIKSVDILALLKATLAEWEMLHPDLAYRLNAPDSLPTVATDETKTIIILHNLFAHARQRSTAGDLLEVGIKCREEDVLVSIVDNGPAIEPQNYQKIFSQIYSLEMNKTNGNLPYSYGLGLYATQRLLTLLGGNIWVSQPKVKGVSLNFTLPIWQ